ncbi:hypothetical protein LCGC14_2656030 [marine sediment metagenome]|uniref:Glycosyltransferase 2-like domain-containing protein n=1 Tax=marine sediment metagenome TaxID=412755 RepID=A0A0F9AFP7_9ZZZZ
MTKKKKGSDYMSLLLTAKTKNVNRLCIGIPMTGLIRTEWALGRWGQIIPCNWSYSDRMCFLNQVTPLGYAVAEARNVIVDEVVKGDFEWLLFIDSDVVLPPDCFVKLNEYMREEKIPVLSGLYYAKCHPPEPLIYRGRGNSHFHKWKLGEKVWVDGLPMGCTLIHGSLLREMWNDAPEYMAGGNRKVRQVFDTPQGQFVDPETKENKTFQGTEDLAWCDRVMKGGYLKKAGWPEIAKKKYPFLVDTSIFCRHIDMSGRTYPLHL